MVVGGGHVCDRAAHTQVPDAKGDVITPGVRTGHYEVAGPNERCTVTVRLGRVAGGYDATWDLVTARRRGGWAERCAWSRTATGGSSATPAQATRRRSASRSTRP